ncbi:MAG: hypothetical protein QCI38_07410, partial [Candidatus Thermoplasmatota archaeon]|nr:hypothetical protein [Candidatus Thermoplasmatota archaeon]
GEEKSISIPPEQAYGPKVAELIHSVPRADLPTDEKLEPGMMFMVEMEDGMEVPVTISAVEEDKVTLDFNPPLAGQTLHFTIKMVEYFKAPEDYQPPGCGCGCGDHDDECCGGHGEDCGCDDEECDCGEGEDCKCGEKDCDCK